MIVEYYDVDAIIVMMTLLIMIMIMAMLMLMMINLMCSTFLFLDPFYLSFL